jgi:uncharacterized protein YkwD
MQPDTPPASWDALVRTGAAVRAGDDAGEESSRIGRLLRPLAVAALLGAALLAALLHLGQPPVTATADSGADSTLFSLTNSDRSSNGVPSLAFSGTLETIGEGGYYGGCGFAVYGRSVDMINRNYFAHPILNCGQYVFSIMHAYGVNYRSAGENIGWVSGESSGNSAASYINSAFMNSSDHRANILNGSYTELGVGSDSSGSSRWTGAGSPGYTNVWMFSEEFAQVGGSSGPPPPPPPPNNRGGSSSGSGYRNSPGPAAPAQPPAVATPRPTPRPTPTPTVLPSGVLPAFAPPPLAFEYQGLLPSSIESVLEFYLDD